MLQAHPTFFEVTTAVAFELFRRAGVDTAVMEVGLGGRLDATNVIEPVATAITSIAYDHQQYLGSTLAEIAREKAGIIKPRVPVVVGEVEPEAPRRDRGHRPGARRSADSRGRGSDGHAGDGRAPRSAFAPRARLRGSDDGLAGARIRSAMRWSPSGFSSCSTRRESRCRPTPFASALARPSWPGRLDLRRLADGREILFDAAHNPAGAATLASYLRELETGRLPLVFAGMHDKDLEGMLRALLPVVGPLVVTRASNRRSADPERLVELARRIAPETSVTTAASPLEALDIAWRTSPRIIVAGSIFLLGDVMKLAQQAVIPFENGG